MARGQRPCLASGRGLVCAEGQALDMDAHRLDRLRARIREAGLAAAVLVQPPNLRYLTGFHSNAYSRPLALVVPADGGPTLIVPRLEEAQAREMTARGRPPELRRVGRGIGGGRTPGRGVACAPGRACSESGGWLARGSASSGAASVAPPSAASPPALPGVEWVDASGWVETLRLVKTPEEVEHHRRAGQLASAGLEAGFAVARAGGSELEIKGASIAAVFTEGARRCPDPGRRGRRERPRRGADRRDPRAGDGAARSARRSRVRRAVGVGGRLPLRAVADDRRRRRADGRAAPLVPVGGAGARGGPATGGARHAGERPRQGGARRAEGGRTGRVPADADGPRSRACAGGGAQPGRRRRDAAPGRHGDQHRAGRLRSGRRRRAVGGQLRRHGDREWSR